MSKKKKTDVAASKASEATETTAVVAEAPAVVETVVETPAPAATAVVEEKRAPGRPITEAGLAKKKEIEERRAAGLLKRGRPVETESVRQKRLAEMKARAEANGGVPKRGRPKMDPEELKRRKAARDLEKAKEKAAQAGLATEIVSASAEMLGAAAEMLSETK